MIKNEVSEAFDITYNEDLTIITMQGMAERWSADENSHV